MSTTDLTTSLAQVGAAISQAATDPAFRNAVLQSGSAALASAGIPIPQGMTIKTVENSDAVRHFVTFDKGEMSAEDQQELASMLSEVTSIQSSADAWAKIVLDSWKDPALHAKVEADPGAVLAQYGYALPAGVTAQIAHASATASYMVLPPSASAANGVTIGDMAESITSSFDNLTKLITAGSYLAGLAFSIGSIMKFKQHKDNPTQNPIGTPVSMIFVAAALLFMPTILDKASDMPFRAVNT